MKTLVVTLGLMLLFGCDKNAVPVQTDSSPEKSWSFVRELRSEARLGDKKAILKLNEVAGDDVKYGVANREIAQDELSFLLCSSPSIWFNAFSGVPVSKLNWKGFSLDELPPGVSSEDDCRKRIERELNLTSNESNELRRLIYKKLISKQ